MLLAVAPSTDPKDVNHQYHILCHAALSHLPHLFINDSPLILLVTALKDPSRVFERLKNSGVLSVDSNINAIVLRVLQALETRHGGNGFLVTLANSEITSRICGSRIPTRSAITKVTRARARTLSSRTALLQTCTSRAARAGKT